MKATMFGIMAAAMTIVSNAVAAEKWAGVDETVVEKLAIQAGRPPAPTGLELSGDLPMFLGLVAGLLGGFAAGYYYYDLFVNKAPGNGDKDAF